VGEFRPLIDELEDALASGDQQRWTTALERVTDLFIAGSGNYSQTQIGVFDDVLVRLAEEIEVTARARLAHRLAAISNAPPKLMRQLAIDDAITVAGPVLSLSGELNDEDLLDYARSKSQNHLHAIAQRRQLSEPITDVLVVRGDRRVVLTVVKNSGARFSENGFDRLVARADGDDTLTHHVGIRPDIPRHHFVKLLAAASAAAYGKLAAANPQFADALEDMVSEVAADIGRQVREASPEHARAKRAIKRHYKRGALVEGNIHAWAGSQNFEKTVVGLSVLAHVPVDTVERALLDANPDMILILAKAAGCSRTTAKSLLLMRAADRGMSPQDLQGALTRFDRLSVATARRVMVFHDQRGYAAADAELLHEIETATDC
jgi:uncharacterized protein (DUF2336 family)